MPRSTTSADIVDRGIVLTGGGSLLKNLDKRLREETGLPLAMSYGGSSIIATLASFGFILNVRMRRFSN